MSEMYIGGEITEEQKRQIKEAQRNNSYIGLTWQLFCQFLNQDFYRDNPRKALEVAQGAIEVWKEFEDGQRMEYPEIEVTPNPSLSDVAGSDSFMKVMGELGEKLAKRMREVRQNEVENSMIVKNGELVDAEFHNPPEGEGETEEGIGEPQAGPTASGEGRG